jgi:hypothetical protein
MNVALLAATVELPTTLAVIGGLVTVVTAAGAAWAIARQAAITASLDTIIQANNELRKTNADLRAELVDERVKRAEMEGRLTVFVDQFAERIVSAVVETWHRTHLIATNKEQP